MVSTAKFYKGDPQSFTQGEGVGGGGYKHFDTFNCKLSAFVPKSNSNSKVFSECTIPFVFFLVKRASGRGINGEGMDEFVCQMRKVYKGNSR